MTPSEFLVIPSDLSCFSSKFVLFARKVHSRYLLAPSLHPSPQEWRPRFPQSFKNPLGITRNPLGITRNPLEIIRNYSEKYESPPKSTKKQQKNPPKIYQNACFPEGACAPQTPPKWASGPGWARDKIHQKSSKIMAFVMGHELRCAKNHERIVQNCRKCKYLRTGQKSAPWELKK